MYIYIYKFMSDIPSTCSEYVKQYCISIIHEMSPESEMFVLVYVFLYDSLKHLLYVHLGIADMLDIVPKPKKWEACTANLLFFEKKSCLLKNLSLLQLKDYIILPQNRSYFFPHSNISASYKDLHPLSSRHQQASPNKKRTKDRRFITSLLMNFKLASR